MSMTVVDGDFPREVLARKDLRFGQYKMPARRNSAEHYDAKQNGPGGKQEGLLKLGALAPKTGAAGVVRLPSAARSIVSLAALILSIACFAAGLRGKRSATA
jgi:hypothetical protein